MNDILKSKINPILFVGILLLILSRFLDTVNIELPTYFTRILAWTSYAFLLFYSTFIKHVMSLKKAFMFVSFLTIVTFVLAGSANRELIYILLVMWSIRDVKFEKVMNAYIVIFAISMIAVACFTHAGFIDNKYAMRLNYVRYFEGYNSWSILPFHFFSFVISYIYIRKKFLSAFEWLGLVAITVVIGLRTGTITAFIFTIGALLAFIYIKKMGNIDLKKISWIRFLPWLLMLTSIAISVLFELGHLRTIDYILGHRFSLQNEAIREYGIHFLGNDVKWYTWGEAAHGYLIVDNSYINILLTYGVIGIVFVLFIYQLAISCAIETNDRYLLLGLILILFSSLIWCRMIVIEDSFLMLSAAKIFSKRKLIKDTYII